MYSGFKGLVVRMLKVPAEPEPPAGDHLEVFRAAPAWFNYRRIVWALQTLFVGAILGSVGFGLALGVTAAEKKGEVLVLSVIGCVVVAAFLGQTVVRYVTLRLDYEMRWYMVTDRSLRIREGVIALREMTLTFANIQEISISQGPIQRLFGVKDVMVRTAGGGATAAGSEAGTFHMHIGYFRGVANAEAIRDLVRERLKAYRDAGLGDLDDHEPDHAPTAANDLIGALAQLRDETRALRDTVAS